MGDVLSIGEVAHGTALSRRMLRHWEELGLIEPARVDPVTGHRRYARSQLGRVRAVAALRALGFGLDAIADLVAADLTHERLVGLLRQRERELVDQVAEGSARLAEVRSRLASVERGDATMTTLRMTPLPALRLAAVRTTVRDETEIPDAVAEVLEVLRGRLRPDDARDVVLTFDGTSDDVIVVTAGVEGDAGGSDAVDVTGGGADAGGSDAGDVAGDGGDADGLDPVDVAAVREGVSVTFDERPAVVADAWIALDAALEARGLRTSGVYRQITTPTGRTTLQSELHPLPPT